MDWSRLRFLYPNRIASGLRTRSLGQAALHGVRELGTVLDRALAGPMVIRINPMGYVCNHACPMCWLQHLDPSELKKQKKVDREQGLQLIDYEELFDSVPRGLETVEIVGGGEPLVHPQCLDIMAAIKRHGWRGSLISNGTLLRETAAKKLVEIDWDYTRISVHAGDRETYCAIQGVDHFEQARTNLKNYTRLRTRADGSRQGHLCIFHVLQRENLTNIDRLFMIAEEVGADSLLFEKIIPYDEQKILTPAEIRKAWAEITSCAKNSSIPCNLDFLAPDLEHEAQSREKEETWVPGKRCSVGFDQSFITAMGDVLPCCFSNEVMGSLREQTFSAIWSGTRYREFRSRLNAGRFAQYCVSNRCTMKGVIHN